MAQNYKQSGDVFNYTVPASTIITSGQLIVMGSVAGVALGSGTEGDEIRVKTCGVFEVTKKTTSGNSFEVGDRVYLDTTTGTVTTDATKTFVGYAYNEVAQATTTVEVMLASAPSAGGASGVTPTASPTLTATGAVADDTKASIDTELAKVKADLEAIVAALEGAGVFI